MKRSNIFWGFALLLLGVLFLLKQQGIIKDVWGWAFPLALILAGVLALARRRGMDVLASDAGALSIPLQGAARVDVDLDHGAGSLRMMGGAPTGIALLASGGNGLEHKSDLGANGLAIELHAGPSFLPFLGPDSGQWLFQLGSEVPLTLTLDAGAANLDLDLQDVPLTFLHMQAGAAAIRVAFPKSAGRTLAEIECGMASQDLTIPTGVAGRIRVEQGASTVDLDEARFAPLGSAGDARIYESSDFDSNPNKLELNLKGGANNIHIH